MVEAVPQRPRSRRRQPATEAAWRPAVRTTFLIEQLGGTTRLAEALGVSKSQPSRWQSGAERPGPEAAQRLLALDYVVASALQVWEPSVALAWLTSANGHLDGARPVDVLALRGPGEVVAALHAAAAGAYA